MICPNCNRVNPNNETHCVYCGAELNKSNGSSSGPAVHSNKVNFFGTNMGKNVLIVIFTIIIWGLFLFLASVNEQMAMIVPLICVFFGWQALGRIQPLFFMRLPIAGWIIYFIFKAVIAGIIGMFVAPFILGKKIGTAIHNGF